MIKRRKLTMAISENVLKIYDYMKGHKGEKLTAAAIADAIGIDKKSVQGSFLTLKRKGVGEFDKIPGTKVDTVKFVEVTDEGKAYDGDLSTNGALILDYLKANEGTKMTSKDIAEALNLEPRQASGSINGLTKTIAKTERPALARYVEAKVEVPCEVGCFIAENTDIDITATAE